MDISGNLLTYQVGAHDEGALVVALVSRYTQVGCNLGSVQVWVSVVFWGRISRHFLRLSTIQPYKLLEHDDKPGQ